ncbi:MAG: DUF1549 and DUF1553 domain-containing protein [Zavarzinella sp.]
MKFAFPLLLLVLLNVPGFAQEQPPTFERDIQPILTRYGCNAGACHGKARGQNGFALSLLGFDANFDYNAIVKEARGRRLFASDIDRSLFLDKASGRVPHGGGKKLPADSDAYQLVRQWIAAGTPRTPSTAPKLAKVEVSPREIVARFDQQIPLKVTAIYSDGGKVDVTHLAAFQSNDSGYASVNASGNITVGGIPGEAAITARFVDQFAVCNVLIPRPEVVPANVYQDLPRANMIDGFVWDKLQRLNIIPSAPAPEATWHRRVYIDIIGRFPTPTETKAFLDDRSPTKREQLVDRLLARPEYADHWANKWADLLRPNPYHAGIKATMNLDTWIREQFRQNRPYDEMVKELLTAQGSTFRNGAVVFYRNRRQPEELATMVSQLFLGVRLDCAKCHQHPSERWSQADFYSFAAFFSRMGRKGQGISAPISGGEEIVYVKNGGKIVHPLTELEMAPTPLLGKPVEIPETIDPTDPRALLVDWMLQPDNPFFAKVIVNRVWAELMGKGLVDPVDDMRDTNPPSNPALLNALAAEFRKMKFDMKKLIQLITTSHVYGLSAEPNETNAGDNRNYSRHYRVRLRAEVLLDAVCDITGVQDRFEAMPLGSRAMQAWTVRFDSKFLDSFGRPDPNQDPPCERVSDSTVVQALHLMNAPAISQKITSSEGRIAEFFKKKMSTEAMVQELYLWVYCRPPTSEELTACLGKLAPRQNQREAMEDLLWALLNTPEFVLNH